MKIKLIIIKIDLNFIIHPINISLEIDNIKLKNENIYFLNSFKYGKHIRIFKSYFIHCQSGIQ